MQVRLRNRPQDMFRLSLLREFALCPQYGVHHGTSQDVSPLAFRCVLHQSRSVFGSCSVRCRLAGQKAETETKKGKGTDKNTGTKQGKTRIGKRRHNNHKTKAQQKEKKSKTKHRTTENT